MARADFVVPPRGPAGIAAPPGDDATSSRAYTTNRNFDQTLGDLVRFRALGYALIALAFIASFNGQWRVSRDSAAFRQIARNLVRSHRYVFRPKFDAIPRYAEKQDVVYPGVPLMLAAVDRLFGEGDVAPLLLMAALAVATLAVTHALLRLVGLPPWIALATVVLLGLNRIFLEQSNELLSDVPFLLGLMLSLYGYERLRRAAGARQWLVACAAAAAGLALAALTRPTFWILAVAWVAACLLGLIVPERSPLTGRRDRRSPYAVALGLLVALALIGVALDPRTGGFHPLGGGYEAKVEGQLTDLTHTLVAAYDRLGKTLDEHVPTCLFAFAVKHSSVAAARWAMAAYTLLAIAAGVALLRVSRLWGLLVAGSFVALTILGDVPRYYLMILPLLLAGWCVLCIPVARWLGPDRPATGAWAHALFGWAPRHRWLPALAMTWGLGIVLVPNVIRDLDLAREQRGYDRKLRHVGFTAAYADGKSAPIVRAAEMVRRSAPPDAHVIGPEPTILTYLADRQVFAIDHLVGRRGRGWQQRFAAMRFTLVVVPRGKAADLYGDHDPVLCTLLDRRQIVPTRTVARDADGAILAAFYMRYPWKRRAAHRHRHAAITPTVAPSTMPTKRHRPPAQ